MPRSNMRPSKTLLTAAIGAAILFVQSPRIFAASIGVNGTTLIFTADAGDDVITAAAAPGATDVLITSSAPVTILTLDCVAAGGGITCGLAGIDLLAILGGSGSDVLDAINVSNHLNVFLSGGDGDDILLGGNGDDILKGGSGDDVMLGGAGTNVCFGGPTDIMIACTLGGTEPPDPTLGASEVPEPATVLLVASGIGAFAARRRRRRP
jgi:Ca2+-binding RTX toxin-like protein